MSKFYHAPPPPGLHFSPDTGRFSYASDADYLAARTRWRATRKDRQARWRGTPDGRVLTVYRNKRGPGWCWCVGGDDHAPVFGGPHRTREEAKAAVLTAIGIEVPHA